MIVKAKLRKGKVEIEMTTETFRLILRHNRPDRPLTQGYLLSLVKHLQSTEEVILIPSMFDIIVINKDGSSVKY